MANREKTSDTRLPKTAIKEDFLNLFHHVLKNHDLKNANKLNLFCLRIANNKFSYDELVEELSDCLITFCLSRNALEVLKDSQGGKKYRAACDKLKDYNQNKGELGELLLYCFLESHLNAPKILSKLEIKTSSNHYVYGADGVHLLQIDKNNFQLVFGESKLDADLKDGVYAAFKSISDFINDSKNKPRFEIGLVNSQLVKEAIDETTYNHLKEILLPKPGKNNFNLDHSFGIFLGFNYKLPEEKKSAKNDEARDFIKADIERIVLSCVDAIQKKVTEDKFSGYSFYIYAVPFMDLENKRIEIIKDLTR